MQTSRTNFCCHYESRTVRKDVHVVDHEENVESEYLLTNIGRDIRASQSLLPEARSEKQKARSERERKPRQPDPGARRAPRGLGAPPPRRRPPAARAAAPADAPGRQGAPPPAPSDCAADEA